MTLNLTLIATVLILLALAAVFLFYPVLVGARGTITMARQKDLVAAYDARLTELDQELTRGIITEETRDDIKQELDRQLLADTRVAERSRAVSGRLSWPVAAVGLVVLLAGLPLLYSLAGDGRAVALQQQLDNAATPAAAAESLAEFINDHPDPQPDWLYQLASAYRNSGQLAAAVDALERVETALRDQEAFDPEDLSSVLGERGELRYRLAGERLTDAAEADFQAALDQNPLNTQAMATLGVAYFSAGQTDDAIALWERFLEVAPDSEAADAVARALERARGNSGTSGGGGASVGVLLAAVPESLSPADQVYIVARPVEGRQPVAIQRYRADELPPVVQLTDADRSPEMQPLSSAERVAVVAFAVPEGASVGDASYRSNVVEVSTRPDGDPVTLRLRPADQ